MSVFERKYCIVDSSGNYYTVNEYDALVVAKGAEAAEWFDILEANKRINNSGMGKSLRTVEANKSLCTKKRDAAQKKAVGSFRWRILICLILRKNYFSFKVI